MLRHMEVIGPVLLAVMLGAFLGGLLRRQAPRRLLRTMAIAAVGCGIVIGLYALGGVVRPVLASHQLMPIESLKT
jgi:hypothetical protein